MKKIKLSIASKLTFLKWSRKYIGGRWYCLHDLTFEEVYWTNKLPSINSAYGNFKILTIELY
jgi:hypothetical protein